MKIISLYFVIPEASYLKKVLSNQFKNPIPHRQCEVVRQSVNAFFIWIYRLESSLSFWPGKTKEEGEGLVNTNLFLFFPLQKRLHKHLQEK